MRAYGGNDKNDPQDDQRYRPVPHLDPPLAKVKTSKVYGKDDIAFSQYPPPQYA